MTADIKQFDMPAPDVVLCLDHNKLLKTGMVKLLASVMGPHSMCSDFTCFRAINIISAVLITMVNDFHSTLTLMNDFISKLNLGVQDTIYLTSRHFAKESNSGRAASHVCE